MSLSYRIYFAAVLSAVIALAVFAVVSTINHQRSIGDAYWEGASQKLADAYWE